MPRGEQEEQIAERIQYWLSQGYSYRKAEEEAENDVLGVLPQWEPKPHQED